MPAKQIRCDYAQLAQIAQTFGAQADVLKDAMQRLKANQGNLVGGDWLGVGAHKFYDEMDTQVMPAMQRLVNALQQARQVTGEISRVIKQAEDDAAACFKLFSETQSNRFGASVQFNGFATQPVKSERALDKIFRKKRRAFNKKWRKLTLFERLLYLQEQQEQIAARYGLPPREVVIGVLDTDKVDYQGKYPLGGRQISIDKNDLTSSSGYFMLRVIGHETRHYIQYMMVLKYRQYMLMLKYKVKGAAIKLPAEISLTQVIEWDKNFRDYENVEGDESRYKGQAVEVEADEFGGKWAREFINNLVLAPP